MRAFFNGTDVLLNFRNMFVVRNGVESDLHVSEIAAKGFKLAIHEKCLDYKSTEHVHTLDMLDSNQHGLVFHVFNHFGGPKFNMAQHGHEEGNLVDKHNITGKGDVSVSAHDSAGDVHGETFNALGQTADSLPLETTDVPSKNVFCCHDVLFCDGTVGQKVFSTIDINAFVLGLPMVFCICCASTA